MGIFNRNQDGYTKIKLRHGHKIIATSGQVVHYDEHDQPRWNHTAMSQGHSPKYPYEDPSPTKQQVSLDESGNYKKAVITDGRGVRFKGFEEKAVTDLQEALRAAQEELAVHRQAEEFRKHENANKGLSVKPPITETPEMRAQRQQIVQQGVKNVRA